MSDAHAEQLADLTSSSSAAAAAPLDGGEPLHDHEGDHDHEHSLPDWLRVGFLALVIGIVAWGIVPPYRGVDLVALAGILIGGFPIFKEAIADLLKGRMTMELSMTIALVAASAIGEFFTALLITIFVLIA